MWRLTPHNVASDQDLHCLLTGFSIKNRPDTPKMTNGLVQHKTVEESNSKQWVKIHEGQNRDLNNLTFKLHIYEYSSMGRLRFTRNTIYTTLENSICLLSPPLTSLPIRYIYIYIYHFTDTSTSEKSV